MEKMSYKEFKLIKKELLNMYYKIVYDTLFNKKGTKVTCYSRNGRCMRSISVYDVQPGKLL